MEAFSRAVLSLRAFVNVLEAIDVSVLNKNELLCKIADELGLEQFSEGVGSEIGRFCRLINLPDLINVLLVINSSVFGLKSNDLNMDELFKLEIPENMLQNENVLERLEESATKLNWNPSKERDILKL